MLTISVRDSGIGIKKEDMQHLFQSFQRVDEASNAGIEGAGLGLMITQQLVEMMGGRISVDSIYQKGSVFTIRLEQQIVNRTPMGNKTFMMKNSAGQRQKHKQMFEAPDARVLVVDDNEMNLLVAKKLLRETNVRMDLAKSGQECLELTRQHFYHVIFMDHMMPKMDGVEALARLRKQENGLCQETPVIVLTANAASDADQAYRAKGFSGYLSKPVSGSHLEAMLLKLLPKELVEYNLSEDDGDTESIAQTVTAAMRKKVHITTECVCDLPKEFLEKFGIDMMHYYVHTDQGRFSDMKEMTSDNFLEYLIKTGEGRVHTETAPVEEYESFFSNALDIGEHVIHFTMAKELSTAFQFATEAAQSLRQCDRCKFGAFVQRPGIDGSVCCGHGREGVFCQGDPGLPGGSEEERSHQLYRAIGTLNLHPVLKVKNGRMVLGGIQSGSMERSYGDYIRSTLNGAKDIDDRLVFITYSGCSARQLKAFREDVEKYGKFERVILQKTSATISGNCGLGAWDYLLSGRQKKKNFHNDSCDVTRLYSIRPVSFSQYG